MSIRSDNADVRLTEKGLYLAYHVIRSVVGTKIDA
jgi:hypothetical protein